LEFVVTLEEFSALEWGLDEAGGQTDLARLLAALVSASREFIGVADLQGTALFVNEAGRELVGLPDLEAVRSTRIIEYFSAEDRLRVTGEVLPAVRKASSTSVTLDGTACAGPLQYFSDPQFIR